MKTMNKLITLTLAILYTTVVFAQETEDKKVIKTKRVRIEITEIDGKKDTTITEEVEVVQDDERLDDIREAEQEMCEAEREMQEELSEIKREFEEVKDEIRREIEEIEEIEEEVVKTPYKPKPVETNMWVMDWGVNNWLSDNTLDLPREFSDMELKEMSANFHLGVIQQGINLYKGKLRFVYGLGLEFNNYQFKSGVTITPEATPLEFTTNDDIEYKRNKIVSRYATMPLMLNFKSNPREEDKSFKIAAGIQLGYLVGAHQKQKWGEDGQKEKKKIRGDYGFEDYRLGYVAQFGYGDLVIYGKYYPTPTFKKDRGPVVNTASVGLVILPF